MRSQMIAGAIPIIILSGCLFVYLVGWVPPRLPNGQLNALAVSLFFLSLLTLIGCFGTLIASQLHQRWPSLAGRQNAASEPFIAIRQGVLFALSTGLIILLLLLQLFDLTFVLVALLLAGLTEAFLQQK